MHALMVFTDNVAFSAAARVVDTDCIPELFVVESFELPMAVVAQVNEIALCICAVEPLW